MDPRIPTNVGTEHVDFSPMWRLAFTCDHQETPTRGNSPRAGPCQRGRARDKNDPGIRQLIKKKNGEKITPGIKRKKKKKSCSIYTRAERPEPNRTDHEVELRVLRPVCRGAAAAEVPAPTERINSASAEEEGDEEELSIAMTSRGTSLVAHPGEHAKLRVWSAAHFSHLPPQQKHKTYTYVVVRMI